MHEKYLMQRFHLGSRGIGLGPSWLVSSSLFLPSKFKTSSLPRDPLLHSSFLKSLHPSHSL
jgi:hypothetical protein